MRSGLPAVLLAHAIRASVSHCLTKLRRASPASFCLMAFALQGLIGRVCAGNQSAKSHSSNSEGFHWLSPFLGRDTTSATLKRRGNSASGLLRTSARRCSTLTEDAHTKSMSTFETNEHLQELTPVQSSFFEEADRSAVGHSRRKA